MKDKQFAPRDKKVQKMTRQGLVEQNAATGEQTRISQREQDWSIRGDAGPQLDYGPQQRSGRGHAPDTPSGSRRQQAPPQEPQAPGDGWPGYGDTGQPGPVSFSDSQEPAPETPPNTPQSATNPPHPTGPHESPATPASGAHRAKIPRKSPQTSTANRGQDPSERLRFSDTERFQSGEATGPQAGPDSAKPAARQKGSKLRQKHSAEGGKADAPGPEAPPSYRDKLKFTQDELPPDPDGKLEKLRGKADKVESKLAEARKKQRTRSKPKIERTFNEATGKAETRLRFEKEVIPPGPKKQALPIRAGQKAAHSVTRAGANKLHQKIYEVEHENVGTQAAHRGELAAESLYRGGKRAGRSALQFVRDKPYRTVRKLEKKAAKANMRLAYRTALNENPKLKSNLLSRFMQKQKIKRQYAQMAREAKRAGKAAKKTAVTTEKILVRIAATVKRHPAVFGIIGLLALLMIIIMTSLSSCSNMAAGGFGAVIASSYLAEDTDINDAELVYTEWETDLYMEAMDAENSHPGYDEYRCATRSHTNTIPQE